MKIGNLNIWTEMMVSALPTYHLSKFVLLKTSCQLLEVLLQLSPLVWSLLFLRAFQWGTVWHYTSKGIRNTLSQSWIDLDFLTLTCRIFDTPWGIGSYSTVAALAWVPWVPWNPWISNLSLRKFNEIRHLGYRFLYEIVKTRKYSLRGYILGMLTHTTAWDRHCW